VLVSRDWSGKLATGTGYTTDNNSIGDGSHNS